MNSNPRVTLYTRVRCHLCDVAKEVIDTVRLDRAFDLDVIDIDTDPGLVAKYGTEVPVILVNGRKAFKYRVEPAALREQLDRGGEMAS
ncbi:MAG: glutaredoxin family protein [Deltaproteobacteria bacterium]